MPTGTRQPAALAARAGSRCGHRAARVPYIRGRRRPFSPPPGPGSARAGAGHWHRRGPRPTSRLAPGTHQLRVKVAGQRRRRSTVTCFRAERDGAAQRARAGKATGWAPRAELRARARGPRGAAAPPAADWRLQRVGPGGATAGERAAGGPERRERNWLSLGSAERFQLLPGAQICILRPEGGEVTVWPLPKVWGFGVAVALGCEGTNPASQCAA